MSTTLEPSAPPKRAFDRAVRHHLEGRLHDAEQYYREAIALHPTFAEACNNLGSILGERGETDEALALFDRAVQAAPAYGEAHHNIGLVRSRLGRHQEAHAAYIAACESDPTRADWANSLGNNCIELCRYQDALVAFDRAVAVAPQEPEFWNNRALALRGVGRTVEAIRVARTRLGARPIQHQHSPERRRDAA
ncbi:MAG: tetratricopeptide repeat protein [Gemmatimonadaceae bacterium]